jgi:hypothetical protein
MGKNRKEKKKRKQIDTCLAVTERGSDSCVTGCAVAHHEALYHVIVVLDFRSSMKGE